MTDSQLSRLLGEASAEPIAPEYDPVWEQASDLLRANAIEPADDSEAVNRLVRAVKFDAHSRQFRHWVPFLLMLVASGVAFFALAEAMGSPVKNHTADQAPRSIGGYAEIPDARR